MSKLQLIFKDQNIKTKLRKKLPRLFQIAETENTKGGKLGMEIGVIRERIMIAFFINEFGRESVNVNLPVNETEIDFILFKKPISIKTISSKTIKNIKIIWTTDFIKVRNFVNHYVCKSDLLIIHVNWNFTGGIYLVKKEIQNKILQKYGINYYFHIPKQGTNARGGEISKKAISKILTDSETKVVKINWVKSKFDQINPYQRWINLWNN